jgi:hypothetical protein
MEKHYTRIKINNGMEQNAHVFIKERKSLGNYAVMIELNAHNKKHALQTVNEIIEINKVKQEKK